MDTQKVFNWVQLLTGFSVIIGLGLVVWELQQTRDIAKLQEATEGFTQYATGGRVFMGENPAIAWAKACDDPDSMSTEDMIVMDHVLGELLNRMRASYARQRVAPDLSTTSWERWTGNFSVILSTEFGRWWWQKQQFWEPEIVEIGNDYFRSGRFNDCADHFNDFRNRNSDQG